MTQEDKELLLKYICMALPYGLKILHEGWNYEWDDELSTVERVVGIDENFIYTKVIDTHNGEEYREDRYSIDLFDDKPYLRPMSSMTDEEKHQWIRVLKDPEYSCSGNDWLIEHHFDIRHLIDKGLAIEVTKENNPYKE